MVRLLRPGCRGARQSLTTESRFTLRSVVAVRRRRTVRPDRLGEPLGTTNTVQDPRGLVLRLNRATRPTAGVGARRLAAGRDRLNTEDVPERNAALTTRRTRETYGGTEDPHQAQGL